MVKRMRITIPMILDFLRLDPVLFMYMFTSFLKYPIFQNLIYEKVCYSHNNVTIDCSNITEIHSIKKFQSEANYVYLGSSLCLILPSIVSAMILGQLFDMGSKRLIALIIPFIGLIGGDICYILQTNDIKLNPYYLLISDIIFGLCGGFTALMGLINSYNVRNTNENDRGIRISRYEATIAFAGTLGSFTSAFIHLICIIYIITTYKMENNMTTSSTNEVMTISEFIKNIIKPLSISGIKKKVIFLLFIILTFELFIYGGINDIQFSYFLYKFAWGDKKFGIFNGFLMLSSGIGTLLLYPYLIRRFNISSHIMAVIGMLNKVGFLILTVLITNESWIYIILLPNLMTRFVATGLRSLASINTPIEEQGRLFSIIELIQGVTSLASSAVYNTVYPETLSFFSGFMYILTATTYIIPLLIIFKIHNLLNVSD
ncbi:Major facilitator superfamily domain, general substrate transporter-containing protein [Strongyloides ratti]|uniref:Major facilitator superfamily domain, general substrate transporter-containing protein n=1 Tax=Strongyloides ratti TaxID=34506 RepID=A0A090LSP8_STRRB|nr:Major facilitator superfamily domain, general substrate transporter-containing protein [Strongyloides ratti]CEF71207.1 Major facilitator superfamily domain, general substrate transporter-containing protein [Strongyloides ratti]